MNILFTYLIEESRIVLAQRVNPVDWHKQELLNRIADMRTKLLDSNFALILILILLHFLTYI